MRTISMHVISIVAAGRLEGGRTHSRVRVGGQQLWPAGDWGRLPQALSNRGEGYCCHSLGGAHAAPEPGDPTSSPTRHLTTRLLSIVSFLLWAIDPFPSSHTHTQTQAIVALGSKALRAVRAPEVPAMIQSTPLPSPPLPFEPGPRSSPHRRGCSDVREPAQCHDVVPGQAVDLGQQRPRANGSGHQARHSPA